MVEICQHGRPNETTTFARASFPKFHLPAPFHFLPFELSFIASYEWKTLEPTTNKGLIDVDKPPN